jgi:hypothetical protein
MGNSQPNLQRLIDWLLAEKGRLSLQETLDKLKEMAGGCLTCTFSALRQTKMYGEMHPIFNYKEQMELFFKNLL